MRGTKGRGQTFLWRCKSVPSHSRVCCFEEWTPSKTAITWKAPWGWAVLLECLFHSTALCQTSLDFFSSSSVSAYIFWIKYKELSNKKNVLKDTFELVLHRTSFVCVVGYKTTLEHTVCLTSDHYSRRTTGLMIFPCLVNLSDVLCWHLGEKRF